MRLSADIIRLSAVAAASLLMTACVHEWPHGEEPAPPVPERHRVTLHLAFDRSMPEHTTVTYSSRSAPQYLVRHSVKIYNADSRDGGSRTPAGSIVVTRAAGDDMDTDIRLDLDPGSYRFLVWTDYVTDEDANDLFYITSDFSEITLPEGPHYGSREERDAYRGDLTATVTGDMITEGAPALTVPMVRPMARFEFIATDFGSFASTAMNRAVVSSFRVRMRYNGFMPSAFNMFTDKPSDARRGVAFDSAMTPRGNGEASLGFDYVFVNGHESSVPVAVEIYDAGGDRIAASRTVDVPVVRGRVTFVKGAFLSALADGGVGVDPDFSGDFDIIIQ